MCRVFIFESGWVLIIFLDAAILYRVLGCHTAQREPLVGCHLYLFIDSDIMGAWSWMLLSSLKRMYQNFNWRFWTDDGMRKQTDDGELESDPHYREMLKVINIRYTTLL